MHLYATVLAIIAVSLVDPANAQDRTFGGFDCTVDCSGHAAGYNWAERHSIDDETDCPNGNSLSFHQGCVAFTQDPTRGADEDDDGNNVGMPARSKSDGEDEDK
jgi:hypothetical protein